MNEGALQELPIGWVWISLEESYDIVLGQSPPSSTYNLNGNGLPFYQGKSEFGNVYPTPQKWCTAPKKLSEKGDVLISVRAPVGPTNICSEKSCIGRGLAAIRPLGGIETFFTLYLMRAFENIIAGKGTGTTFSAITGDKLKKFHVPLPPLPEQRAIVSKLEQLFSDLDNGIENFKKAQVQLKIYRQAVLKKAFEGELTKKWRDEQTDLPSAEELLQQVKDEREKHYQVRLEVWKSAVKDWEYNGKEGKKPTQSKKSKELPPLTEIELAKLPELSEGKFWIKLGMLTLNVEYGTSAKSKKEGKIPVLRMGNIQNNRFVWNDLVYTDNEDEINKYLLKKGDVLFNRTNSPELVGKTAIYNGEKIAIFAGYLIRINQIHNLVNPNYLNYFLNSHTAKVHANSVKTDGVNQSNINGEKLKNYPFPYFSLSEQSQIVQEIETRLSICDNMEATIAESLQKAESLRQSILKKAFEGKLLNEKELEEVRNAPDWEPAEKLLERIKAEKTNTKAKKKGEK